jgi:nitrogen fixation/metabolism regulation signal transduction histidine kinase
VQTILARGSILPERRVGYVIVFDDITEVISAQRAVAWAEVARRLAHEIKNPLTPIRLAAERLRVKHREGDPAIGELLEESVAIIVREVGKMQSLVDEFSRYARMPGPQLAATAIDGLVSEVVALYRDVKPGVSIHTARSRRPNRRETSRSVPSAGENASFWRSPTPVAGFRRRTARSSSCPSSRARSAARAWGSRSCTGS